MNSAEIFFGTLLGGIISFFSPCIFPLLPVYLGYLAGDDELFAMPDMDKSAYKVRQRSLQWNVLLFVAGISTVFITLGFLAGTLGNLLIEAMPVLAKGAGVLVIIFGLLQLGLIQLPFLQQERRVIFSGRQGGWVKAYMLGLAVSFGWTPCVGPVLSSILLLAATQGGAMGAALLLVVYTVGFCLPFLAISLFTSVFLRHYKKIYPYFGCIRITGGILLIGMGILLFTGKLNILQAL